MKKMLLVAICSLGLLYSSISSAALITAGGVVINPLNLTGSYTSFEDFYDFRIDDYTSNTGYEKANHVMIFMVQLHNEMAMIMTAGGPGGFTGKLQATVTANQGAVSFINDPYGIDPFDGSTVTWKFSRDKNDGLIFSGLLTDFWNIDLKMVKLAGGLGGLDVLSFDANGKVSLVLQTDGVPGRFNVNSVSTPSILALFAVIAGFLMLRSRKKAMVS